MTRAEVLMMAGVSLACATLVRAAGGSDSSRAAPDSSPADSTIERFLQSGGPEPTSYAARRTLTASTMGGRMRAELEAWTYLDPDGTFRFDVIRQDGSDLLRARVLVAALEKEQRSHNQGEGAQAALTRANYDFALAGRGSDGLVIIRLIPKRQSPMLLDGSVLVRPGTGDLVRIDGRLSQPPSWWTRHVDIVRQYSRIHGIRVPTAMTSQAEARIAGAAWFAMTYHYTTINGQAVEAGANGD